MSETPPNAPAGTSAAASDAAETDATAEPTLVQRLAAELIGTFAFVLVGVGALALGSLSGVLANLEYYADLPGGGGDAPESAAFYTGGFADAITFGLALVAIGFALSRYTVGFFNPLLALSSALAGRISWAQALLASAAQLVGAVAATFVLFLLAASVEGFDAFSYPIGASGWGESSTDFAWWGALILEILLAAILVVAYLAATDAAGPARRYAPLVVGTTFAALYMLSMPTTNGGINPLKAISTALFSGGDALGALWVFIIGPVIGTAVGAAAYLFVLGTPQERSALRGSKKATPAQPWSQPGQAGGYPQQGYGQQGYGAAPGPSSTPSWESSPAPSAQESSSGSASAEQPIIQDGWQWDPQSQQWIPAQQQGGGWSSGASESTQVRPPQ